MLTTAANDYSVLYTTMKFNLVVSIRRFGAQEVSKMKNHDTYVSLKDRQGVSDRCAIYYICYMSGGPQNGSPSPGGGGGGGRGGATWFQLYPDLCVEKGRTWVPFRPQVSEMSDMISLKMGVNFATSLKVRLWVLLRDQTLTHLSIDISLIPEYILNHNISLES